MVAMERLASSVLCYRVNKKTSNPFGPPYDFLVSQNSHVYWLVGCPVGQLVGRSQNPRICHPPHFSFKHSLFTSHFSFIKSVHSSEKDKEAPLAYLTLFIENTAVQATSRYPSSCLNRLFFGSGPEEAGDLCFHTQGKMHLLLHLFLLYTSPPPLRLKSQP